MTSAKEFLDTLPVPTLAIDGNHTVTLWNRACELVTGLAAKDVIGTRDHWKPFHHQQTPLLADLLVEGCDTQEMEKRCGTRLQRSSLVHSAYEGLDFFSCLGTGGQWIYFFATALHDPQGRVIGALQIMQDLPGVNSPDEILLKAQNELKALVDKRAAELALENGQLESHIRQRESAESELLRRNAELTELNRRLSVAQDQLMQSEKLASIGQLAAGVAHEINNPIGYIFSNFGSLEKYIAKLMAMLHAYEQAESSIESVEMIARLGEMKKSVELDYMKEDIPSLINESKEGIIRVRKIVQDLKDFSRIDTDQVWQWADLHHGINSTLNIVNNEVKYKADVVKEYGDIPEVECLPSQINQVIMNIVVNAAHAIHAQRGTITIRTGRAGEEVWIEIADNGTGIPKEVLPRIFDPFYTTKPVGSGTGLGLSLSYGIIQKHRGRIEVQSKTGEGTTFRIVLPVQQNLADRNAEASA